MKPGDFQLMIAICGGLLLDSQVVLSLPINERHSLSKRQDYQNHNPADFQPAMIAADSI